MIYLFFSLFVSLNIFPNSSSTSQVFKWNLKFFRFENRKYKCCVILWFRKVKVNVNVNVNVTLMLIINLFPTEWFNGMMFFSVNLKHFNRQISCHLTSEHNKLFICFLINQLTKINCPLKYLVVLFSVG